MSWYVIRSATRQEVRALEALTEVGFPAYMPQGARWHRLRHGGDKDKDRVFFPLFTGYLFVECEADDIGAVLKADGVHDVLRAPNDAGEPVPMPVPEHLIAGISDEEVRGVFDITRPSKREIVKAERMAKGYKKGERVIVTEGVYAGFVSSVIRMAQSNRKVVILGPKGKLTLDAIDIEQADIAA